MEGETETWGGTSHQGVPAGRGRGLTGRKALDLRTSREKTVVVLEARHRAPPKPPARPVGRTGNAERNARLHTSDQRHRSVQAKVGTEVRACGRGWTQGRPLPRAASSSLSKQNSHRLTQQCLLRKVLPVVQNDACARTLLQHCLQQLKEQEAPC